jgi:hypothetical protein
MSPMAIVATDPPLMEKVLRQDSQTQKRSRGLLLYMSAKENSNILQPKRTLSRTMKTIARFFQPTLCLRAMGYQRH